MFRPSHSSRFDHPNNIGWAVQIIRLLTMCIKKYFIQSQRSVTASSKITNSIKRSVEPSLCFRLVKHLTNFEPSHSELSHSTSSHPNVTLRSVTPYFRVRRTPPRVTYRVNCWQTWPLGCLTKLWGNVSHLRCCSTDTANWGPRILSWQICHKINFLWTCGMNLLPLSGTVQGWGNAHWIRCRTVFHSRRSNCVSQTHVHTLTHSH